MNIIQRRIEKALRLLYPTSIYHQTTAGRRRGSYRRGVARLPHIVGVKVTTDTLERLGELARVLNVERGLIIRDALEMYLSIADTEFKENPIVEPTGLITPKPKRRGRVASRPKMTAQMAAEIKGRIAQGATNAEIAKQFSTSPSNVSCIRLGKSWRSIKAPAMEST
jgi:hypothetical protein